MSFGHREFLWLLLLFPVLGAWSVRAGRLRGETWRSLNQRGAAPPGRSLGILMSAVLLILALARLGLEPSPMLCYLPVTM